MANLRLLILGAHPDDPDISAGGLASIYTEHGHTVKMISVTDGSAGHQTLPREELKQIRRQEAANSGKVIGAEYITWDYVDGYLEPNIELREAIIREIRTFKPDLVLTHRIHDYHPDHRAVGMAVRDASFMVTVPTVVPDAEALRIDPVVAYMTDLFTDPTKHRGDIVIDIDDRVDIVTNMLDCHKCQVYDWLPYNENILDQVPESDEEKLKYLKNWYLKFIGQFADRHRERLLALYGNLHGSQVKYCEALEVSEYARELTPELKEKLFWFLPKF